MQLTQASKAVIIIFAAVSYLATILSLGYITHLNELRITTIEQRLNQQAQINQATISATLTPSVTATPSPKVIIPTKAPINKLPVTTKPVTP